MDAVVVGSGPNGMAAAITLAEAGASVTVIEMQDKIGGGTRTAEITLPGFHHDLCSAIHPLAAVSPFFQSTPLADHGLKWIHADIPIAHPLEDGTTVSVHRDLDATVEALGRDGQAYLKLVQPFVQNGHQLCRQVLAPRQLPKSPLLALRFAVRGAPSARHLAQRWFKEDGTRGMFAGMAAHSVRPLTRELTGAVGLMFCVLAHLGGWPMAERGSQSIAQAMGSYFLDMGGEIITGWKVRDLSELPKSRAILFDLGPHQIRDIVGDRFPSRYSRRLSRFRYGPGVFKLDWALDGPIPWTAIECQKAGTVHVGGTLDEICDAEKAAWSNAAADKPFVLVSQQSNFDRSRAPGAKYTGWAYCHVPHGSTEEVTTRIEKQIERFAPGFQKLILGKHITRPFDLQRRNPNCVGGDITGGVMDFRQIIARPTFTQPYCTPLRNVFICSASTPPGAGVHGMCGVHAANVAIRRVLDNG